MEEWGDIIIKYSIFISLGLVLILLFQASTFLWPGVFFLIMQGLLLLVTGFLTKVARQRRKKLMVSIIQQFHIFFSFVFPIWILLAITGHIAGKLGRIYAILVVLIFIVLSIMLLQHVIMERSLLDEYEDRSDNNDD